jgi:phenylalanyl-tRNA synthetase beta chain
MISDYLSSRGFNEIMSNSLTKTAYYETSETFKSERTVRLYNPLSSDLNGMRQSLVFGGLEAISRNINFRNEDLRLYEFGNVYFFDGSKSYDNPIRNFSEEEHVGLWITGKKEAPNWAVKEESTSFYTLKASVEKILLQLGIESDQCQLETISNDIISEGLEYRYKETLIARIGYVHRKLLKAQDIDAEVFYGDLCWTSILKVIGDLKVSYTPLPKYPEVRRDLALLLDKEVKYSQIKELALRTDRQILRNLNLFDVYEGENLPEGKKSYAISFILRDDEKTLTDKQIDKTMNRLASVYERELGAKIR